MYDKQMEKYKLDDAIICIDFKSYYASVECVKRGLNPMEVPLCVANEEGGDGAIVMAASPALKEYGFPSRCRLRELKEVPDLFVVKPSMQDYIDQSLEILKIYMRYVSRKDIFIYSIDEVFIDLTNYLTLHKKDVYSLAKEIIDKVFEETKIICTCGIGKNMIMAKFALDIESKHCKNNIAHWDYEDIPKKLWPITDLTDVWSIGRGKQKRLNKMGLYSVGDIANTDVNRLIKEFGILGEELYLSVHGIDVSKIADQEYETKNKSIGRGHTFTEDYVDDEVLSALLEINFEVMLELKKTKKKAGLISVFWSYSFAVGEDAFATSLQITPTSKYQHSAKYIQEIFKYNYTKGKGVRKISVSFGNLSSSEIEQIDLFNPISKKDENLEEALLEIQEKFGVASVLIGESNGKKSIAKKRSKLIGGHNARV